MSASRETKKEPRLEDSKPAAETLTVEELTDLLKRTQANFDNYRKQMQAYIEDIKKMAAKDLILQLLPVIDNFELAFKSTSADAGNKEFIQGMRLIYSQLTQLLQDNNIVPLDTKGKDFDPYYHEALVKVNSDLPKNRIMEEFQKGYMMQGKVLRHAKVKLSAGPAAKEEVAGVNETENESAKNENSKMKTEGGN